MTRPCRAVLVLTGLLSGLPGCRRSDTDQLVRNREVVTRQHALVWSKGDLAAIEQLYTPDFVCHFVVGPEWRGREGVREQVTMHRRSFPDWHEQIEDIVAEGDPRVVTRFRSSGTHRGEFQGIAPTGRRVRSPRLRSFALPTVKSRSSGGFPTSRASCSSCSPWTPASGQASVARSNLSSDLSGRG